MIESSVLEMFRDANVLVTGGTGLLGRCVVDLLVNAGAHVCVVSLDKIKPNSKATYVEGDLTNYEFCLGIMQDIDYLFHLAGIKGSIEVTKMKPASFFVPLLMFNTNVLESARVQKVRKTVYTSSIGAYQESDIFVESSSSTEGQPMDFFPGWAKRMAELQIQAYKIQYHLTNFSIVRPCNVYGPGDNFDHNNAMVIPSLMNKIHHQEKPVVIWGDGSAIRDFSFSKDVAEGIILAMYYGTSGQYINLGSGIGVSIRELVEMLNKIVSFDYAFDKTKSSGFTRRVMDIQLAKDTINYRPSTSLYEGLRITWDWFKNNHDEYKFKKNYFTEDQGIIT